MFRHVGKNTQLHKTATGGSTRPTTSGPTVPARVISAARGPGLLLLLLLGGACTPVVSSPGGPVHPAQESEPAPAETPIAATPALDLGAFSTMEQTLPALTGKRVVFVGEQHTRYDHHLVQLEIIRALHREHPQLAIGMEPFQQPFQDRLDDYVAGSISEQEMLRSTEYFQRWRMDYRLYAPILRYAREHRLPVVALNVPVELTRKVGRVGLDGLNEEERNQLPAEIDRSDSAYRQRVKEVFEYHPNDGGQHFEQFLEVQLLWDEGMAERAAEFLRSNPGHRMVIIAGNQHVAYGSAIPDRLKRRETVETASILNSWNGSLEAGLADYLMMPTERTLPAAGRIGALLDEGEDRLKIEHCLDDSPCKAAGMRAGDWIQSINGETIRSLADLRLALWDKQPGDSVTLDIGRRFLFFPAKTVTHEITLQ